MDVVAGNGNCVRMVGRERRAGAGRGRSLGTIAGDVDVDVNFFLAIEWMEDVVGGAVKPVTEADTGVSENRSNGWLSGDLRVIVSVLVVVTHVCFVVDLITRGFLGSDTVFLNEGCLHTVLLAGRYRNVDNTTISFKDSFVYVNTSICVVAVMRFGVATS